MLEFKTAAVFGAFLLAGLLKGVVGLGLPSISLGLLVLVMPPVEAAAILIVPSFVTNLWQMLAGPHLVMLFRRLWPLLVTVVAGTLAGSGWMASAGTRLGPAIIGVVLVVYSLIGLAQVQLSVPPRHQRWLAAPIGLFTGLLAAVTGVFVFPGVLYLNAIGLDREQLVQALGLFFMVATFGLAGSIASPQLSVAAIAPAAAIALAASLAGMGLGQLIRQRLSPPVFRRVFFVGIGVLGAFLSLRALV